MKYIRLQTWALIILVVAGVVFILTYASNQQDKYLSQNPVTDSLITQDYPRLYDAIVKRDADELDPFLSAKNKKVRRQAWQALANTPIDNPDRYINQAIQQNIPAAWFAIAQHGLTKKQLQKLQERWESSPKYRAGISRVLGKQGNKETLHFLVSHLNTSNRGDEFQFALAVGRLSAEYDLSDEEQLNIVDHAFGAKNHQTTRAYLYGWYRGDAGRLSDKAQSKLATQWQLLGAGISADVDQYLAKILAEQTAGQMTIFYNGEQRLDTETPLAIELAKSLAKTKLNKKRSLAAKILLTNTNPHVQIQMLQSLKGKLRQNGDLSGYITESMLPDSKLNNGVWVQAMETAMTENDEIVEEYRQRLQEISNSNSYLLSQVLSIYGQVESVQDYLQRIQGVIAKGEPLPVMFSLQALNGYYDELDDPTKEQVKKIRNIVFDALALHDRGVSYTAATLLSNESLFKKEDFSKINKSLTAFSLPGDIEVYQAIGDIYYDRFKKQAKPVIDSLAAQHYRPLNKSLADKGWEVKIPKDKNADFRMPRWERLWELGRYPVWNLKTTKGDIAIRLNTLGAPATVSMIDSLSRAGSYDGIPFHRVVPNFVIQGGDIERSDGFGGPDFVLPTEASTNSFARGAVGIASAGTDTEGSQYFIMNQWKPHLNGSYSRFGKVVEGMDVVGRIQEGDKVISTSW